jgi:exopolysaccharide biosynthesis polyprenyl glycosylphosphotransferase
MDSIRLERPTSSPRKKLNPRLRIQQVALRTRRRHFLRAVRRISVLAAADLAILEGARSLLAVARETPSVGPAVVGLFPQGFLGGGGALAAFLVGLALAGGYASEERWASARVTIAGVGGGAAIALWQSIDTTGLLWTVERWTLVTASVAVMLLVGRSLIWVAVVRYRLATKPTDRVIFVGDPLSLSGRRAAEAVLARPGIDSLGWLSERGEIQGYLGHPSAIWEVLSQTGTDTVVLCGEMSHDLFDTAVEAAAVAGCRVLSVRAGGPLLASEPRAIGDGGLRMLELTFPAARAGQDVLKRGFDFALSGSMLLLASPVLVALAAWIRLDSRGPTLFVQERVGQAGRVFRMLKFRTMVVDADEQKADLAHLNPSGDPRLFKIPNDPRVTRAGRFLRKWSLDELPQLFNVLRGQMSLVGPRPFFESDLAAYDDHHFIRLTVKPGLTGLWQVKGRSSIVDFEEVIDLDREYVEQWSLLLDVRILLATLPAVFRRTGAY